MRVTFEYCTGLKRPIFANVRLMGSWDAHGRYSAAWSSQPMTPFTAYDGCPAWRASLAFDSSQVGWLFHWGIVLDALHRLNVWGIPTEVMDTRSTSQHRDFKLVNDGQVERYWLTDCRRLGANKLFHGGVQDPSICFSVFAPHASAVDTVIGEVESGYIWSDGRGVQRSFPMRKNPDGIWRTPEDPALARFADWNHKPYMFRITRSDGAPVYRTDLYARCQIGTGQKDPEHPKPGEQVWSGTREDLDGTKGCSVVVDPEIITKYFSEGVWPETQWLDDSEFWADEYDSLRPVPIRAEDLVIYELHVGALGFGQRNNPGKLRDAIALLDHLSALGINAIELLPMSQTEGFAWGYGSSHHMAVEFAGGGRDQFKFFIRDCHRRGIAVIMDVVYNHFNVHSERSQWMYDSPAHHEQIYHWYEGREGDWSQPTGGYLDNGSTGWAPNFRDELVRKLFVSSAAAMLVEFHIDGFRVDLTQAIHRDNVIHDNGAPCHEANLFGAKFLREWVRALRLIKPSVILFAEDHSGWDAIIRPQEIGGIGFDATWWVAWYHHVIGASNNNPTFARLIHQAGFGGNEALAMSYLGRALAMTPGVVIYHASHDECGNAAYFENGQLISSARPLLVAVNNELNDTSRPWAEARCRVACSVTILAAGIPMFFMGEEVAAKEPFRYEDFLDHREDIPAMRASTGAKLFRYYQDLIQLRRLQEAFRSPYVETIHVHDENRVVAFRRWLGADEFLVLASLNNRAFAEGYWIASASLLDGTWTEVLNSDAAMYGGHDVCNQSTVTSSGGRMNVRLPANGVVVLQRL